MTRREEEAIEALKNGNTDLAEQLISEDICLPKFAEIAWENDIFVPHRLYENAPASVRDEIIEILEADEEEIEKRYNINGLLMALSAIGDDVVFKAFTRWEKEPKNWRSKLYVGPAEYAKEAEWAIENGQQKQLFFKESYEIVKTDESCESVYGYATGQKCSNCGSSYQDIVVLDGNDVRLSFLNMKGKIRIKSCLNCLPWSASIFSSYEEDGEGKVIINENGEDTEIADEIINKHDVYTLSESKIPVHFCTAWEGSAIGGRPSFVDDANYSQCPKCGKTMKHLAQLAGDVIGYDGNVYVQICEECKIAASMYQQS